MTETIEVTVLNGRLRSEPWFSEHDLGGALGNEQHRSDVMKSPAEVCIWASLAAHNARSITLGFLRREFDDGRGDWVTKPHVLRRLAVGYVDERALVVVDPTTSTSWSIGTDTIFDIHVET